MSHDMIQGRKKEKEKGKFVQSSVMVDSASPAVNSSNIGLQLLQKQQGTGIVASEQEEERIRKDMTASGSSTAINSSNIGFQLLKKHGWKEGTGLGISEQGRLEPVQTYLKNNKRGLGAEKIRKALKPPDRPALNKKNEEPKKAKGLSKKMRKMQELESRLQEKEFERAFLREFWPDNV